MVGVPLLFFEISIGQLSGMGPLKFFGSTNLRPVFSGVGFFLMISSVYKAIGDTASGMWPITSTLTILLGDIVEGSNDNTFMGYLMKMKLYLGNTTFNINTDVGDALYGFTQLDALTVISLSITWVLGVLVVICGLHIISKVLYDEYYKVRVIILKQYFSLQFSYVTLLVPFTLLAVLVGRAFYSNPSQIYAGLTLILSPSWWKLLSISLWIRAITDTVLSFNVYYYLINYLII